MIDSAKQSIQGMKEDPIIGFQWQNKNVQWILQITGMMIHVKLSFDYESILITQSNMNGKSADLISFLRKIFCQIPDSFQSWNWNFKSIWNWMQRSHEISTFELFFYLIEMCFIWNSLSSLNHFVSLFALPSGKQKKIKRNSKENVYLFSWMKTTVEQISTIWMMIVCI